MTVTFDDQLVAMVAGTSTPTTPTTCTQSAGASAPFPTRNTADVTGVGGSGLSMTDTDGDAAPLHVPFLDPVADSGQAQVAVVDLGRAAREPRDAV